MDAVAALARSCSVPFREVMGADVLASIFRTGCFAARWTGHVMVLVDEAPIAMVSRAVGAFPPEEQPLILDRLRAVEDQVGGGGRIARWMRG